MTLLIAGLSASAVADDELTAAVGDSAPLRRGVVTASLVFCVGPLTILGSLQDGLGQGADLLVLKSVLEGCRLDRVRGQL